MGRGARPADVSGESCFHYYYAAWLEAAGARVVGIPYDASPELLDDLLGPSGVGGVLFTGGSLQLGPNAPGPDGVFYRTAQDIFARVQASSQPRSRGGPAPDDRIAVHGTCQGFQVLASLLANSTSVLSLYAFDSEDLSLPLDLAPGAASSLFLSALPPADLDTLSRWNVTANLHHDGVAPSHFAPGGLLHGRATLLSTNLDRKGKAFASTLQATDPDLRVSATQWHPERPQFEWRAELNINHTAPSVRANGAIADYLVAGARDSLRGGRVMGTSNATAGLARSLATLAMDRRTAGDNDPAAAVVALFFGNPEGYAARR